MEEGVAGSRVPNADFSIVAAAGEALGSVVVGERVDGVAVAGVGAHEFRLLLQQSMLPDVAIGTGAEEVFALRDEAQDVAFESAGFEKFARVLGGPRVNLTIASCAEDALAVRAEGDSEDGCAVAVVGFFQLAGLRFEVARGLVAAGGSEVN